MATNLGTIDDNHRYQKGEYEGVSMPEILTRAGVPAGSELRGGELAKTIIVTAADGYRAVRQVVPIEVRPAP